MCWEKSITWNCHQKVKFSLNWVQPPFKCINLLKLHHGFQCTICIGISCLILCFVYFFLLYQNVGMWGNQIPGICFLGIMVAIKTENPPWNWIHICLFLWSPTAQSTIMKWTPHSWSYKSKLYVDVKRDKIRSCSTEYQPMTSFVMPQHFCLSCTHRHTTRWISASSCTPS